MQFMDTHVHLQDFNDKNATEIISWAQKCDVTDFVCVSAHENDWQKVSALADKHTKEIIPAFGLHPWYVETCSKIWLQKLEAYLLQYPTSVVGECGIDKSRNIDIKLQESIFHLQIELAKDLNKVLIVHAVRAQEQIEKLWQKLPPQTIFHSFNGKKEFLRQIIEHGFYVGINFSILRNPQKEKILTAIPVKQLLFETDAPYQPQTKGTENHPSLLPELAHIIANIRGENTEFLAQQIYNNACTLFKHRKIKQ